MMIDLILTELTQGPAGMIDRPPPPAAPKSGHRSDRSCRPKRAGRTPLSAEIGAGNHNETYGDYPKALRDRAIAARELATVEEARQEAVHALVLYQEALA